MELAVSNIAWNVEKDRAVIDILASYRIAAIEVAPTKYWPAPCAPSVENVQQVRSFWESAGLRVRAMQSMLFGMPQLNIFQAGQAAETRDYLHRILDVGSNLGATRFVFGSPRNRDPGGLEERAARSLAVDFFRGLALVAADLGAVVCIEPNPKEYGCRFLTNSSEALTVAREVNHPGFGINLDSGIMLLNGESPDEVVPAVAPWLKHFHVSHPHLLPVVDDGPVNHALFAAALRSARYEGCVSVEMRCSGDFAEDLRRLKAACGVLNKHYRG